MQERYRLTIDGGTDKAFTKEYTKEEYEAKKDYIADNYQGRFKVDVVGDADTNALDDNAMYTVRIDDADFSKEYTGKELKSKIDYLNANYADRFRVESVGPVEAAQPTPSAREQLQAFYQENGAFLDDFEKRDSLDQQDAARNATVNEGLSFFKPKSRVSDEERTRYKELAAQRKDLEKAWYTSDEYLSQKNATALELGQMRDDIHNSKKAYVESQPQIKMSGLENAVMEGKTMGDYESQQFDIAARIMDKTIKLHNAPSKYDSNSGLKNMGIGAADKATDPALLSAGLTEITDNVGARVVLQKVQKELGNLNDLSEEKIEKILSPAEKAVLRSWAMYAQEQLNRQGDLSLGYQAGQGAVESLAFMAEFALTGGVGKAASEGAETLAKWLGKKWYGGFKGLGDEAAEAVMKAAGEKTLGKYGQKLGLALAETAGRTLVMPSTYRNISEKATEIETDEEGNSYLVGLNDAFIKGYADSFIENLSEGGRVNALGDLVGDIAGNIPAWKKMVNAFSNTKASELLKRLNSTGIMNTLRAGGWHGFGEEYLEEWYGNALRTITGVNKNALKDFATLDNQMVTLASFLPITIFGGTVSTGQVISAKRDLDKKAEALQSALMGRGYDEAQAKNMIDMMRAETPQGISNLITPLIRRVAGANENEARELAKPAMEFAWAVQRYQSYDTKYSYQQQEQRDNLKAEMETKLGKFWMEGEDGQQTVQRGVNEKGEVVYLLGKKDIEETAEGIGAEKEVAAIDAEGKRIFVFPSDYRLEEELPMNDFLGIEIMTQKRDSEAVRMASERDAKFAEVKSRSRLGTQLNIGTNEAPVIATISKVDADGVVVETPEGFRKITYTELANKYADINPAVYTDAELDEQEADNISAERAQREAALDQEYENDDDAIEELAEAENEIEQSVEEATKLPLKDDGTVDQAALWNESPSRWAQWNDEQKQDGGADTLAYLNTAIKAQTAKIEQLVAAQEAETDFDRRDAIATELSEARMRQGDLLALHEQYTAQVEAQAIQQQAAQPVQPAPQLTEEEKAALEEERRKPLRAKAKELSEKLGVKVKIAEDLSDVKESKAREQLLKSVVSNGKQKVAGWYNQATGEVTIFLPHAESVEDVEKTFIHEVVAHKGLRGLLGEEGFNVLCDAVWDMMSEGDKIRFINYPGVNGDKRAAADEYMAHFAETLNLEEAKPDMWERIIAIIKQILDSMGVRLRINQEGLSSAIAASYQKLLADAKAAQGVSAEAVTETTTETIAEEPQTEGAEVISEERESFRVVNKQEDPNGVTPEQIDEINRSVGGEIEVGEDDAPVRFSVTAIGEGAGLEILKDDGDGNVAFVLPDGRRFNANNLLKPEDIKSLPNTVLGYMMKDAKSLGNVDTAKEWMLWNKYTLMLNAILLKGSAENGGFDTLSSQWQWIGDTIYKTVAINSDSQYSFSLDITRVCKKNEAVINAIAEMQARLGYGITPGQIMDIYLATSEEGYQVPCPVCYVFSRYIRNGKYATIMINGQRKYGNELVDPSNLTPKQREKKVKFWLDELAKIKAENNEHSKEIAKANSDITTLLDEIDKIAKELTNPQNNFTEEEKAQMMSKIYELDARYKAALNVVSQASLDSWITQFAIHKVKIDGKEQWTLYEDSYMGFPEEMALDLRQTSTVMRKYPAIQRFRNSRGAAAGKEITFVANNDLGDVPLALGSSAATKDLARPRDMSDEEWEEIQGKEYADLKLGVKNLYQQAVEEKDSKKKAALLKKAKTRFTSASIYAKQQSLRGGQRMWSWSDNIERLAPDVFINLLQLEMLGGALQSYSKQLEGIKLVASMNGYVNGSLMGKGNGYKEVTSEQTEEVDGQLYLKDGDFVVAEPGKKPFILKTPVYQHTDGKLYVLEFDDVVGIDPFGKEVDGKHMKGLFELNAEYDRAGNIIVGMNDLHIRMCMADDRIFFIIPWHSSGANTHILAQMYEYLGVEYDVTLSQDYTDVQSEKRYKAPTEAEEEVDSAEEGVTEEGDAKKESNKISQFLVDFWNDHYENAREYAGYGAVAGKDFACGIEGGVEPSDGNGNLSASQMHYRELRDAIFVGVKVPIGVDKNGKPKTKAIPVEEYSEEWFNEIMNDAFLSQVYTKVRSLMGDKGMTSADTKAIYPYEYWDESSTYATADINGARYLEYCRRLGYKPKFCGKLDGKPESDHGNFTDDKGYWKVLIDRRMYAISGRFQDLTPVTADNFTPDLVDPEVTKDEFIVTRVADEAGTQTIVDKAIAREENRPGGIAKVDYDMTLSDALNVYNNGDVRMRASAPSRVIDLIEEAKKAVAREEAKDNVSFRITPEQDKAYMDAVEAGDMETAQRMVDEAARLAMPNTKVVDKKGNPTVVYHGTKGKFNTFAYSREDIGFHFGTKSTARTRIGRGKDARIMQIFLNLENPLIFDTDLGSWDADYIVKDLLKKEMMSYDDAKAILLTPNGYKRNSVSALVDLRQWMSNNGYDGIVYPNWYESNGKDSYIAFSRSQIKSADPVTYDNDGNVTPLSERFNPEKSDIRFRFTPRTEEQREKLFADAKEKFGVTNNFKVAGYMLPDGSLLDFSEANDGGDPNVRSLDHRSIEDVIMEDGTEYESRWMYLADFMNEGAIRLLPEYAGINLMKAPTKEQRQRLMDFIYKYNGEVILEIADERLNNAAYVEYDRRTSPSRIFRDIDGYFNEGIVPQQDIRFRMSNDNQAIFVSNAAKAVEGIKQEKATPEQWLKMIEKNGGLKAGEDKWMGLSDWLKASDKKTLTKEEVLAFVNENMIQIEEQHYGINAEDDAERTHGEISERLQDKFDNYVDEYYQDHDWEDGETDNAREYAIERLREEMGDTFPYTIELEYGSVYLTFPYEEEDDLVKWAEKTGVEYTPGVAPINDTRLNYTTDGLENKHEIALTVPTIERWGQHDDVHFGDAGDGRAVAWIRFGETMTGLESNGMRKRSRSLADELEKKYGSMWNSDETYEQMSEEDKAKRDEADRLYHLSDVDAEWIENKRQFANRMAERGYIEAAERERRDADEAERLWSEYRAESSSKKVLVIDEIQSKRHQEGREKGYAPKTKVSLTELRQKAQDFEQEMIDKYHPKDLGLVPFASAMRGIWTEEESNTYSDMMSAIGGAATKNMGIPDAPFDKNWHELAMKRMLRYAAENGYDAVAWTKGEQQAERYDLSDIVKSILVEGDWYDSGSTKPEEKTIRNVVIAMKRGGNNYYTFNKEGVLINGDYEGKHLSELVGKELAEKLINAKPYERISGDGLKVGGEGMKGFYDRMLPAFMNKYGKKWGVKVEDIELPNLEEAGRVMHSVPVTEEMKASVMEGQVMFRMREEGESAMDFHQSALNDFKEEYNVPTSTTIVDVNDRDAVAVALGYTPEEFTDEQYQYILNGYEVGGSGVFDPKTKKIAIFVKESKQKTSQVYNDIFHENTHYLVDKHPELLELGEWLWNNPEPKLRRMVKEKILAAGKMYEGEEFNEMLSGYTGLIMSLGKADVAFEKTPSELKKHWELIFNAFGYGPERNYKIRRRGAGDNTGGVGSIRYRSNVGEQKHNNASQEALTAEERRIIGEYFPEFNKSEGVRMRVNSQGEKLTEGQKEFFANSKAVDKDGNLLVLYHGTPRAGFTEFKSGWFTTSKEDAISYSGDRKGRLFDPNEKYEPETLTAGDYRLGYMTFDSEEDRAEFLERFPYADEVMSERDYENARMEAEDEEYDALTARRKEFAEVWNAYREYERERFVDTSIGDLIANPEAYTEEDLMRAMLEYDSNAPYDNLDDMSTEERKDALVSALQNANEETEGGVLDMVVPTRVPRNGEGLKHNDLGNRTYEVYANVENPYEIDANGRGSEFESGDIYKAVEEGLADEQYDGVIIRNWRVGRTQQLGDVVVPKNGSQIKLTSNENPTESSDIRFRTSLELDEEFGDAWRNQQNEDGRHSTQVANTKSTYEKIGHYLEDAGMKGASILDASSGLGLGTQALREMGFQVDDVEPFPSENREAPTFSSYADIDGKYDVVISNAVLNVIPDDWRADVLHQMADAVKEGGKMIINTRPASNIAQQGVEGKTRITLDSPSEILVKRGDRIAAYQKGFTSEELAEWIKSELGEGWRVEKATKKNSGISGEGTAVVIKDGDNVSFRTTGTPTDEVVANGVDLTPSQTSEVAANIFAALPEESRKKITEGLNGNILGLKDAILQIPASLASKENWNDEDRAMSDIVAEEMTKMAGEMTRPFSAPEALWLLYNNLNKSTDLVSLAQRSLVQRNLGFDAQTLATENEAKESLRFRQVGDARVNATASLYNKGAVNVMTRLKESFVDMNASVEELVKAIEERTGKKAEGFENILWALNQQSSRGLAAMEDYERRFLNPMYDAIRNIMDKGGFKYEDVVRYVILKHGLERNKKLAQRDAKAHYQEIYDEIIEKINSMDDRQKRTYLTNAQLKEADAKAKLATLQAKDTSTLTEDEMKDHKKELAVARKEVKEAEEYRERAEKIRNMSEQEAKDELDKIFEKIENGTDSIYKELRESDYSGLTSMFYDQLGVDRNLFATEEAYQSALMDAKKDKYSSLEEVEAAAEAEVKKFEGAVDTKELWKRVNAATKETLRQQYEANMISKDQYESLRDMFEYYVPLRGFKDNTAEDMYTYYRKTNSTGYTKPILGAEGRKTEAESPFGWIASMAGSAIASNVKNEAKLALFYFVSNRQNNGVATISKTWYAHTPGDVDERGRKIFKPIYPPFSEDLSSDAAKAQYEQWQDDMRKLKEQGLAYEAGQRLNLGNSVVNISDANKPEHIVAVKVGGKEYTIVINGNPRAAQAINGELNLEGTADDYSALFGPVLRWMSSVNTSYNPEFWITNMMRDMAFTWMAVNTKGADDKEYRKKFGKNWLKAWKVVSLVAKNENGTLGNSPIEQAYKDFVENGGVTGYTQIKDNEIWEKEIEQYLKSNDPESLKSGKMMRGMKTVFHAAHRFGESLEQVSRFAAFLTARETGKSINEAINDAKEITVNFNRKGSGKMISLEEAKHLTDKNGRPLSKAKQWMVVGLSSIAPLGRRFIMFFNAAIQGLNATYKLWKANPKRFKGWVMGYFAVGAMNAILHAMMDDDDDYLDMPQYERRNALMIGGNGAYLKWALPQEARAFYALGDIAVESLLGRNPQKLLEKGGEAGQILTTIGEVLPINPTEGWRAIAPSIAIPVLELMINEDYKGEAIYNESKWLSKEEASRTAKWNTAKSGTGWTHLKIAQGLNFLTGGDKYDAGFINIRPEAIEHLVQSAFGGTIRTADKFVNTITSIIDTEEEWTVKQTPFLNRVLTLNDERYRNAHVNEVFDYYAAEAEHTKTLEKKYRKDGDSDALLDLTSSDEYQWMMIYENYKKPLENVRERLKVAGGTQERKQIMREQDELKKMMIKQISNL